MIGTLINLALAVLNLLMFKVGGIIGISKFDFFNFSSTERVKTNIMGSSLAINQISCYHHFGEGQETQSTEIKNFLKISLDCIIKFFINNIYFNIVPQKLCQSQKFDILHGKHQFEKSASVGPNKLYGECIMIYRINL